MNILIIGGNRFTGEAFVNKCLFDNHNLTIVNRSGAAGVLADNSSLAEVIKSHRDDFDYSKGHWDACIDFCGYSPESVKISASALWKHTLYVYISSGAAYCDGSKVNKRVGDKTGGAVAFDAYGIEKYRCEEVIKEHRPDHMIIRPPYILGENRRMVRLNKWASMIDLGVPIPVDGDGNACFSVIWYTDYVRVLYNLVMDAIEGKVAGNEYNITSPDIYTTVGLITELSRAMGKVAMVNLNESTFEFKNYNYILESNVPDTIDNNNYVNIKEILKNTYAKDNL